MATNLSYWEKQHFFDYDIIIAGSGIVGLSASIALKIKEPNLRIAILESGFLPTGASTRNAGFACFGSISELIEQEKSCGTDGLHQLIERRWKGLLKLRNLLGDESINYQNHGGYEIFKPEEYKLSDLCFTKIDHFNSLIRDIVKTNSTYKISGSKIADFNFSGINAMIENRLEAQIDTGRMMRHLLLKSSALGIFIFNSCKVTEINETGAGQELITTQGNFLCKKLLLCTNAFIKDLLPDIDVTPGRGQVIVTSPIKNLKPKGTFHYDRGYYYFRNVGNRVLIGGGRNLDFKAESTTTFGETPIVNKALVKLLEEIIIPGSPFEIEYSWSGIMAFGSGIDPIIKEVRPGVFCAVRCNGMGVAIGTQTGEDAAKLILELL